MLADVRQDNPPILGHDRCPRVIFALHDRTLEDFETIRIVARLTAQKSERLFAAAATQLGQ
jgi:hypothetical protein